jgi:hypothetical protein
MKQQGCVFEIDSKIRQRQDFSSEHGMLDSKKEAHLSGEVHKLRVVHRSCANLSHGWGRVVGVVVVLKVLEFGGGGVRLAGGGRRRRDSAWRYLLGQTLDVFLGSKDSVPKSSSLSTE